jgi:hypothetical protein
MLTHPTIDQLHALGLHGMAKGFNELDANPEARALEHPEWLALSKHTDFGGAMSLIAIGNPVMKRLTSIHDHRRAGPMRDALIDKMVRVKM